MFTVTHSFVHLVCICFAVSDACTDRFDRLITQWRWTTRGGQYFRSNHQESARKRNPKLPGRFDCWKFPSFDSRAVRDLVQVLQARKPSVVLQMGRSWTRGELRLNWSQSIIIFQEVVRITCWKIGDVFCCNSPHSSSFLSIVTWFMKDAEVKLRELC